MNPIVAPDVAGVYVVELLVNDGITDSAPDEVTATILAPAGATQNLAETVAGLGLLPGTENALDSKLNAEIDASERGLEKAAANKLNVFINQVEVQSNCLVCQELRA